MATTKINIVNRALGFLGAEFISSLTEDTKAARFANELFDDTRDAVFRMHPWNCCIKRTSLSKTSNTPAFYFTSEFQLPADWLRMVRPEDDSIEYKIDDRIKNNNFKKISFFKLIKKYLSKKIRGLLKN